MVFLMIFSRHSFVIWHVVIVFILPSRVKNGNVWNWEFFFLSEIEIYNIHVSLFFHLKAVAAS